MAVASEFLIQQLETEGEQEKTAHYTHTHTRRPAETDTVQITTSAIGNGIALLLSNER